MSPFAQNKGLKTDFLKNIYKTLAIPCRLLYNAIVKTTKF